MPQPLFPHAATAAAPVMAGAPTFLIVPGLNGSGPDHWQSAWERMRDDTLRADLGDWNDPTPARWITRLESAVADVPGPVILVAHSLGCIATALWAYGRPADRRILGALLVAPCDPEQPDACARIKRFAPLPRARLPFASTVVASANDPYATLPRSRTMAAAWGSAFVDAGALGHINAASRIGAWRAGQALAETFLERRSS